MTGGKELANRKNNATSVIFEMGQNTKKDQILSEIIPDHLSELHRNCLFHIHDLEYYDVTYNCIGISVSDIVGQSVEGYRVIFQRLFRGIIELTNSQSGGIGFIHFDTDIASYLSEKNIEDEMFRSDFYEVLREFFANLNTNARYGCEKPYVTLNFGLGTGERARFVSRAVLEVFESGHDKKPFLFPNLVFKLKKDVNFSEGSPNHDLFEMALRCTAKKMIPTYFNCDSFFNKDFESNDMGIMGCRTRVASNINGKEGALNRGNIAAVTLNLVRLSVLAKGSKEAFYKHLDQLLDDARDLLIHRLETLIQEGDFVDFLSKNYYLDSSEKDVRKVFKNGTLSVGFIGLWDAVANLEGKKFETFEEFNNYLPVARNIVNRIRSYADEQTEKFGMNFSVLATAAESVTGRFESFDREKYGDRLVTHGQGYYVNSFHIPVGVKMGYTKKLRLESEFHSLCNGGCISYVEFSEIPFKNVEAVKDVVECAYSDGCNYFGLNFPLDYCDACGYIGRINVKCPTCSSEKIRRLRRVSGYLSEVENLPEGKKKEMEDRKGNLSD